MSYVKCPTTSCYHFPATTWDSGFSSRGSSSTPQRRRDTRSWRGDGTWWTFTTTRLDERCVSGRGAAGLGWSWVVRGLGEDIETGHEQGTGVICLFRFSFSYSVVLDCASSLFTYVFICLPVYLLILMSLFNYPSIYLSISIYPFVYIPICSPVSSSLICISLPFFPAGGVAAHEDAVSLPWRVWIVWAEDLLALHPDLPRGGRLLEGEVPGHHTQGKWFLGFLEGWGTHRAR